MTHPPDHIPEEVLKEQDGKKVPLTLEPGGPVIGEATIEYVPGKGLNARLLVTDPAVAEFVKGDPPSVIFRQTKE